MIFLSFLVFKKSHSEAEFIKLKRELLKPSTLILGQAFLLLLCSEALLASFYLGETLGWLKNTFQKFLVFKIGFISLLFVFIPICFYMFVLKKSDLVRKFFSSSCSCHLPYRFNYCKIDVFCSKKFLVKQKFEFLFSKFKLK
ncbi:hypothetical protein [Campylobacter sp. MIT 97-5078]|uniref:hypothetical protein n=1 Tax=Campylobacter sp. MIT 97-5078 TaxID=1548153 RepID=UPI000513058B|nr:hypothetical protein [Campylobacter sp. MIT 97-5078]KGI56080.1 hypothetical protein LR59_09045 [Campylobacter sp. MIT 97-5078]TQR27734.1 hypothetical protein DMB91_02120 [Campylobacter sp. MIT 97-5078]